MGPIDLFTPGGHFPPISITGDRCQLMCDHCRGRYLRGMTPAPEPGTLRRIATRLEREGATGLLISGGSQEDGSIPLDPFIDTIRWIKESTSLRVNLHTGLLDRDQAGALVDAGVDAFSVDLVQGEEVLSDLMHLKVPKRRYADTLSLLLESGARRVVPHICVDLPGSRTEHELDALGLISRLDVTALVVLAFVSTPGTPFAGRPSSSERLISFVREAVDRLEVPVVLGCMRPRGRPEVDVRCVEEGAAALAVPSARTVAMLRDQGYRVRRHHWCCALYR